jgi:hypothetical protein
VADENSIKREDGLEEKGFSGDAALTAGAILAAPVVNASAQAHFGESAPPPPPVEDGGDGAGDQPE